MSLRTLSRIRALRFPSSKLYSTAPARTSSRGAQFRTFTVYFALTLLYSSAVLSYVERNHATLLYVNGDSMSPLLSPTFSTTGSRDLVLVKRNMSLADDWRYLRDKETLERKTHPQTGMEVRKKVKAADLQRGMVVAFWTPHKPDKVAVKRVVALDGDMVTPLDRKGKGGGREPIAVPYGHVWVEGENEDKSKDSNDYGPVSKSLIEGVVTRIISPSARRGAIDWQRGWDNGRKWEDRIRRPPEELGIPEEWAMI